MNNRYHVPAPNITLIIIIIIITIIIIIITITTIIIIIIGACVVGCRDPDETTRGGADDSETKS